jgi:hypothetical protein
MKSKAHEPKINRTAKEPDSGELHENTFSRPIAIEQVPEAGADFAIEANADERSALAALDGLVAIGKLEARFHVVPRLGGRFNVTGHVTASITQTCVVSLEPFEAVIEEDIDVDFAPAEDIAKQEPVRLDLTKSSSRGQKPGKAKFESKMPTDQGSLEDDEEDPPDAIIDGKIDLGGIAAEFLALALDPYPRKPGAQFEEIFTGQSAAPDSPFAILRKLDKPS